MTDQLRIKRGTDQSEIVGTETGVATQHTRGVVSYDDLDGRYPSSSGEYVSSRGGGKELLHTVGSAGLGQLIDFTVANVHDITLSASSCTVSFTGATPGKACSITLVVRQDITGSRGINWSGITWPDGGPPTLKTAPNAIDVIDILSLDGTIYYGFAGAIAVNGINGLQLRTGSGVPDPNLGVNGEVYYDYTAKAIYGPKTTGNWGSGTSLVGPSGTDRLGVYGDGSDGALTFDGTTTVLGLVPSANKYILTRDVYATNLTLTGTTTIDEGGFRLFARGTLTIGAGCKISRDGVSATSSAGAAILSSGTAGGCPNAGGTGGTGTTGTASTGVSAALGGQGGAGGASSGGGSGGGATGGNFAYVVTNGYPRNIIAALYLKSQADTAAVLYKGGQGGGGGNAATSSVGGGGAGGGGIVAIYAQTLVNNGTISAVGGNGAAGTGVGTGAGGGGGGGGGAIVLVYGSKSGSGSQTVAGGTGGAAQGAGAAGVAGPTGNVFELVH